MSPYFISIFNRANKCPHCHASKKEGYSVCSKHLKAAKTRWRKWQVVRRAEKKCCYCHKKSFKGWVRCKEHTIINRVKCKAWDKAHPNYGKETWIRRKALFEPQGVCKICASHRKVQEGFKKCWICKKRSLLFYRKISTPPRITRKALTLVLKQHKVPLS